ncbi:porin family protein [Pedobacter lusitanus]|uniref:porin family protein n=1 Tax=Pedobacter lusitanus TaxID=1503925 RepID=UPI001364C3C7|nr:porin family protein [Pedobacter lusitanus]
MKQKHLLLCLVLIGTAFTSRAQFSVGLETGINKNTLYTNTGFDAFTQYKSSNGFNIGVPVRYDFNSYIAIQADPQYIQKNYKLARTDFYDGVYTNYRNSYVQLPVMAHLSIGDKKLKGFLNLGAYAGYWASSHIKGTQPDIFGKSNDDLDQYTNLLQLKPGVKFDQKYDFDSRRDRRIELGALIGIGIEYELNSRYQIFAETRYYHGLTDLQKNYMIEQVPRYNQTFTGQVGCMYRFGK